MSDFFYFDVDNKNYFFNLLIANYIDEYVSILEKRKDKMLEVLNENIIGGNKEDFIEIAYKLAHNSIQSEGYGDNDRFISLRIANDNVAPIASLISKTNQPKVSVFLRNLFMSYLTLPAYKREQIIYAKQYNVMLKALSRNVKISYRNRKKRKSHTMSPYSVEQSLIEFHNYVIGTIDGKSGATSVKLLNMESVIMLSDKCELSDNFKEAYKVMQQNGIQFAVDELKRHKVYMSDEAYKKYNVRYIDKPVIVDSGADENGEYYIFNCSKFQLENFFMPFGEGDVKIVEDMIKDAEMHSR